MSSAIPFELSRSAGPRDVQTLQRRRQASGQTGERIVTAALEASQRAGLGYLTKRPTNMVVRNGVRRFTGTAGADYAGLLRGGRACYLEVKRVSKGERLSYSALRESQHDELNRVSDLGAICAVVVVWGPAGSTLSVIPWGDLPGYAGLRTLLKKGTPGGVALGYWAIAPGSLLLDAFALRVSR